MSESFKSHSKINVIEYSLNFFDTIWNLSEFMSEIIIFYLLQIWSFHRIEHEWRGSKFDSEMFKDALKLHKSIQIW